MQWFETDQEHDPLLKAGLAHLWFVTLHPFDDGNGRIARAIGNLALQEADQVLTNVLFKANFWRRWPGTPLNTRQSKVINRLLDGFEGQLNNKKWAAIGKCSSDTALRDINDLVVRGIHRRTERGGRSTNYELVS